MSDRRKFVKELSFGSLATIIYSPVPAETKKDKEILPKPGNREGRSSTPFTFSNGLSLELIEEDGHFLGVGMVRADGTVLRSGIHALGCELRTPDGNEVSRMIVKSRESTPEQILLTCSVWRRTIPVMEYMLHSVRNRENLYGWTENEKEDPATTVTIKFFPVTRKIGTAEFKGFSYQYEYHSEEYPIFKILDRGTWEPGGTAVGNEVWMRTAHVPSIVHFDRIGQKYSSERYMAGIANPNIFQFLPLQTELQGFTFQLHRAGCLVTWATSVSHVRTLIEKPAGSENIFHFHQHCGDLSARLSSSPVEVLWLPFSNPTRNDGYNIYESVRNFIHAELNRQAGIKTEYIPAYGSIEEWEEPDFDFYTKKILPVFIAAGVKRIFLPNQFQNMMNTWGLSNMCCNIDYKFSATAGEDKIARFCSSARAAGVGVEMWGNTAVATSALLFSWRDGKKKGIDFLPEEGSIAALIKKAKDPLVRNPSNAIEADHYTPSFAVLNLRDKDIMDYWMSSWKKAFDTGISGIFLDSSFNMTSDKFHFVQQTGTDPEHIPSPDPADPESCYRPAKQRPSAIQSQYFAHLQLVKQMQDMGYSYCGEDLGVFGTHRHGPEVQAVMDNLPLWRETILVFDEDAVRKAGKDPMAVFFEGMAFRVMWSLRWDFKKNKPDLGITDAAAYRLFHIYNEVGPLMHHREIINEGQAVKYVPDESEAKSVWWVLRSGKITLPSRCRVAEIPGGRPSRVRSFSAKAGRVYLIEAETDRFLRPVAT